MASEKGLNQGIKKGKGARKEPIYTQRRVLQTTDRERTGQKRQTK
jgi:hypothetical protein